MFPGGVNRVYEADRTLWIGGLKSTEKEENSSPAEAKSSSELSPSTESRSNRTR